MSDVLYRYQFDRAVREGWVEPVLALATRYALRAEVLLAIASRETNMGGRSRDGSYEWLIRAGDAGNGFGIMQIDRRSFPAWVAAGHWRDAVQGFAMGAQVLADKHASLLARGNTEATVSDLRGVYRFVVPVLMGPDLERAAIASYNCGWWAAYHLSKGRDVDHGTTGKNYSADVLTRATMFAGWLATT